MNDKMKKGDLVLALLVVTVWGANFTVIKLGLAGVPPMLLAVLRYTLTAIPAVFFVKRPALGAKYCIAYGLTVGVGQFACLFYAMDIGMPAGIASVVLQAQALFTILFAKAFLSEKLMGKQIAGFAVAAAGLYFIGTGASGAEASSIPIVPFLLTISAAAFWGLSNIVVRHAAKDASSRGEKLDMLSLVVWSSLVPPIPLMAIALMIDDINTLAVALGNLNAMSVFAVLYLAFFATLFGYGTWSVLLSKYPAGRVAPLSLLVPITGFLAALIVLNEQVTARQLAGGLVIIAGIVISNFGISPIRRLLGGKRA